MGVEPTRDCDAANESERFGHQTSGVTPDLYGGVIPSTQREAASALDGQPGCPVEPPPGERPVPATTVPAARGARTRRESGLAPIRAGPACSWTQVLITDRSPPSARRERRDSEVNAPRPVGGIARYQEKLWVAPLVGVLFAFALATIALLVDYAFDLRGAPVPVFVGSGDTARSLLSAIAGAVATLLALVFTIIAVIIQVASGQYSPRLLPTIARDRPTHFTIGIFVATFTYSLVVLLNLRFPNDDGTVAGLSVTLAFVLAVASLVTFAIYSNHIVHSVRISSIVERVGAQTRQTIATLYPEPLADEDSRRERPQAPSGPPDSTIPADEPGVLARWDERGLFDAAEETDARIHLRPKPGEFVPAGAPLLEIYGPPPARPLRDLVTLAAEPSLERDVVFGLRQLSDVALRAMSTSVDDPATAVQAVDQLHDLLRRLVTRDLDYRSQLEGRIFLTPITWEDALCVAVDEIRISAVGSMQVAERLHALLCDLRRIAPAERRASIDRRLQLLQEGRGAEQ